MAEAAARDPSRGPDRTGPQNGHADAAPDDTFAELRALRRQIESYHRPIADTGEATKAVDFLVPHLAHADRHIRYAARVALEFLPVGLWQEKVLGSSDADTVILGAVALAHQAEKSAQPKILAALGGLNGLDERKQHVEGRRKLFAMSFDDFEKDIAAVMSGALGPAGFDFERDVAAITVNRWPHGYA